MGKGDRTEAEKRDTSNRELIWIYDRQIHHQSDIPVKKDDEEVS